MIRSPEGGPSLLPLAIVSVLLVLLSGCSQAERKEIRLTPTSSVNPGVRIIVDNCPGPSSVTASVRDEVFWRIEDGTVAVEGADIDEADGVEIDGSTEAADDQIEPTTTSAGLREFLLGQTPDGWNEIDPLDETLSEGIRYTIITEPDGQSIDFSLPDLAQGLVFNGEGRSRFNSDLLNVPCSQPADFGRFARNLAVLGGLWITSAALVMVGLILLLFVITRRFSRIRAIERRASSRA